MCENSISVCSSVCFTFEREAYAFGCVSGFYLWEMSLFVGVAYAFGCSGKSRTRYQNNPRKPCIYEGYLFMQIISVCRSVCFGFDFCLSY